MDKTKWKLWLSWELWLSLGVLLTASCGLQLLAGFDGTLDKVTGQIFRERCGGNLLITAEKDPRAWLKLLYPDRFPDQFPAALAAGQELVAALQAKFPEADFYPVTLSACYVILEDNLLPVTLQGRPPEALCLLAGMDLEGAKAIQPGVVSGWVSAPLLQIWKEETGVLPTAGEQIVLVRDPLTCLDVLPVSVRGVIQANTAQVYLELAAMQQFVQPVIRPGNNGSGPAAPSGTAFFPGEDVFGPGFLDTATARVAPVSPEVSYYFELLDPPIARDLSLQPAGFRAGLSLLLVRSPGDLPIFLTVLEQWLAENRPDLDCYTGQNLKTFLFRRELFIKLRIFIYLLLVPLLLLQGMYFRRLNRNRLILRPASLWAATTGLVFFPALISLILTWLPGIQWRLGDFPFLLDQTMLSLTDAEQEVAVTHSLAGLLSAFLFPAAAGLTGAVWPLSRLLRQNQEAGNG